MSTLALIPLPSVSLLPGMYLNKTVALPFAATPGRTQEQQEEEQDDSDEEEFFEGDDEEFDEEEDGEEEENPTHRAITTLTIAIIPIAGTRQNKKPTRFINLTDIDMTNTDMYYDECDTPKVYARIQKKLGKTREELSTMLFGY